MTWFLLKIVFMGGYPLFKTVLGTHDQATCNIAASAYTESANLDEKAYFGCINIKETPEGIFIPVQPLDEKV